MNSTLKSLLFWMVLVVVGVLIWNFSNQLSRGPEQIAVTEFLKAVDEGQVAEVIVTGSDIVGKYKSATGEGTGAFRTYVPPQLQEQVGAKLVEKVPIINAKDPGSR